MVDGSYRLEFLPPLSAQVDALLEQARLDRFGYGMLFTSWTLTVE